MRRSHTAIIRRGIGVALGALALAGCKKDVIIDQAGGEIALTWSPSGVDEVRGVPGSAIKAAIAKEVAADAPAPLGKDTWQHATKVYKSYNNVPLWLTGDGFDKARAGALMYALTDATSDGLRLDEYPLQQLGAAIDEFNRADKPTADQLAHIDVMLTAAYVALGEDLMTGQIDPREFNQAWHISQREEKVDSALSRSLRAEDLARAIGQMRPTDAGYDSLRVQLAFYRAQATKGWTKVPEGKTLKTGSSDSPERIAAVVSRLAEEGYTMGASSPGTDSQKVADSTTRPDSSRPKPAASRSTFSKPMSEAVAEFQARHNITVTGSLNPETVDAMNVSPETRAAQIASNLERYRWMPRALGDRYIMVNVPAFQVAAYDSGRKTLEMKVIVGEEYEGKATPVFADSMEYVVFRPYWNVTPSIQEKEFADKTPEQLAAGNYEYYKDGGVTRIRQRPGPKNALGLVKFLFPNDFNIYLHDTPNGELFKKDVRAFSHGCIRLEKPDEMAAYVLGWDMDRVHAAMESGPDNKTVRLARKIPVYITYFTTYVTDGKLYFGNDLYHRDDTMVEKMMPGAILPPDFGRAARALQSLAEEWGGK
jgi:murein L,D-transpeptidase YcbB/YkuD